MESKNLSVDVKIGESTFTGTGAVSLFSSVDDVMSLLGSPESAKKLIADINFSLEAKARNAIRAKTLAENGKEDKLILAQAKNLIKTLAFHGKTISEADALAKVKAANASLLQ